MPVSLWRARSLHFYSGLTAALFIAILGATGGLLAFENEINRVLNPELSFVHVGRSRVPLDAVVNSISVRYPGFAATGVVFPPKEDLALAVALREKGVRHYLTVFVDPYNGNILGDSVHASPFMSYVRQLHTRLMLGSIGEVLVVISGALLIVLAVSGIRIWLQQRYRVRDSIGHTVLGSCLAIFALAFGLTALRPVPATLVWKEPDLRNVRVAIPKNAARLPPEVLVGVAERMLPEARAVSMALAGIGDDVPVDVILRYPEDRSAEGKSVVY